MSSKTPSILRGRPKAGKVGVSVSANRKAGEGKPALDHQDQRERPIIPEVGTLPEHPAYVGLSISTGMKTEFARESVDVAAWCTLPCDITPAARADAYEEARFTCLEEVKRTMNKTLEEFFPELMDDDNDTHMDEDPE